MHTLTYIEHPILERAWKTNFYGTQVEKADQEIAKLMDQIAELNDALRDKQSLLRWWQAERAQKARLLAEVGEHP
jgi:DNA gyrase/topoisomerase IV subunit A